MLDVTFHGKIEAVRQTHFTLDCPVKVRGTIMHNIVFENDAVINFTGWKDVGIC
jgi:hypothetical protein